MLTKQGHQPLLDHWYVGKFCLGIARDFIVEPLLTNSLRRSSTQRSSYGGLKQTPRNPTPLELKTTECCSCCNLAVSNRNQLVLGIQLLFSHMLSDQHSESHWCIDWNVVFPEDFQKVSRKSWSIYKEFELNHAAKPLD